MPKCDFKKVALQLYWNRTLAWVISYKFAAYFRTPFPKNTFGGLLLRRVFTTQYSKTYRFFVNNPTKIFRYKSLISSIVTSKATSNVTKSQVALGLLVHEKKIYSFEYGVSSSYDEVSKLRISTTAANRNKRSEVIFTAKGDVW